MRKFAHGTGMFSVAAIALVAMAGATTSARAQAKPSAAPAKEQPQAKGEDAGSKKVLTPEEKAAADFEKALKRAKSSEVLFSGLTPIEVTLTTDMKRIRGDKKANSPWRSGVLTYTDASGKVVTIPTQLRTRGIWRLKNCEFPPIRLNFKGEETKGTLFEGVDKPKLVNFCRNTDQYEQYVLQEAQVYRIYNLLTPVSHRMRLLQVNYVDSASGKALAKRNALLVEEPDVMAARNGGPILELKGAVAADLDPFTNALVGLFQYFIGNTDFSIYGLHNVELVNQTSGIVLPVPYDFDFSGVVNASYATTDPKLPIQRVRDRLFRGYCADQESFERAFARFNEKKDAIYALYADSVGQLMDRRLVEQTLRYYDDFYKTINDAKRAKREIIDSCVKTN